MPKNRANQPVLPVGWASLDNESDAEDEVAETANRFKNKLPPPVHIPLDPVRGSGALKRNLKNIVYHNQVLDPYASQAIKHLSQFTNDTGAARSAGHYNLLIFGGHGARGNENTYIRENAVDGRSNWHELNPEGRARQLNNQSITADTVEDRRCFAAFHNESNPTAPAQALANALGVTVRATAGEVNKRKVSHSPKELTFEVGRGKNEAWHKSPTSFEPARRPNSLGSKQPRR